MFDVIVLGATFAAAGIAQSYKKSCLVLERRVKAGYEFFGALNFGKAYEQSLACEEAAQLRKTLTESGLYGGDRHIYPYFRNTNILFQTDVVRVEQREDHFVCHTHGIDGFSSFAAKAIIDTRCWDALCACKTYNLLIESPTTPVFSGAVTEKAPGKDRYILRCAVPTSCGYPEARQRAFQIMEKFSKEQRLILSADEFDYGIKETYPKTKNGIFLLPSKAFENPALAFEAGSEVSI